MKFKSIRTKMLLYILTIIFICLAALTGISYYRSSAVINDTIEKQMNSELSSKLSDLDILLKEVSSLNTSTSIFVENTYSNATLSQYENYLSTIIFESDLAVGSGIWFEPYIYDATQEYVGPYSYIDGDKAVVTYDYSNAEYDYFSYDWYTKTKSSNGETIFSELYLDEVSDLVMSSNSSPIYDGAGNFIGCTTLDIELSAITEAIKSIKVGKTGYAMLLNNDGTYIAAPEDKPIMNGTITDETNNSLAQAGSEIIATESGQTSFSDKDGKYNMYYTSLDYMGWKLVLVYPQAEIYAPVQQLLMIMIIICILAVIISVLTVIVQVNYVTKNLTKVKDFANKLSEGDFKVEPLNIKSIDELGQMGNSLNTMLFENKSVIKTIKVDSFKVGESANSLAGITEELNASFANVEEAIKKVSANVMNASAATEEINASVEEVTASINILSSKTQESMALADEITKRSKEIGDTSLQSSNRAKDLSKKHQDELSSSIEEAKVVDSIGVLVGTISDIASQINLLSLNASIEAARAGEHGRGFAVVAEEIGHLASETATSVDQIKQMISKVQSSFSNLEKNSQNMLSFIVNEVMKDYDSLVSVAVQYGKDAGDISSFSADISQMSSNIDKTMAEVANAISEISESSQQTSFETSTVMENMSESANSVNIITEMAHEQKEIVETLDSVVNKFKLD